MIRTQLIIMLASIAGGAVACEPRRWRRPVDRHTCPRGRPVWAFRASQTTSAPASSRAAPWPPRRSACARRRRSPAGHGPQPPGRFAAVRTVATSSSIVAPMRKRIRLHHERQRLHRQRLRVRQATVVREEPCLEDPPRELRDDVARGSATLGLSAPLPVTRRSGLGRRGSRRARRRRSSARRHRRSAQTSRSSFERPPAPTHGPPRAGGRERGSRRSYWPASRPGGRDRCRPRHR